MGGGGSGGDGGGGAGGLSKNRTYDYAVKKGSYTVTVGDGGAAHTNGSGLSIRHGYLDRRWVWFNFYGRRSSEAGTVLAGRWRVQFSECAFGSSRDGRTRKRRRRWTRERCQCE